MDRRFQLIVWGATGFTGSLVCEHIAADYQGTVAWALAGRNRAKLEAVRNSLASINPYCKDVPILVGSLDDPGSLDSITGQTQVLLSLAGPFALVGEPVVASCVRMGTHYCDSTGEALWINRMVQKYHEAAVEEHVKIVHCCAYDSIPADLGVLFVAEHMARTHGKKLSRAQCIVNHLTGGASGGSIASSLAMALEPASELRDAAASVYYLCGRAQSTERQCQDVPDHWWVGYNKVLQCHTEPFLLQFCDRRIVHRSNALLGGSYGHQFCVEEAKQSSSWLAAVCAACFTVVLKWLMLNKRLHAFMQRNLPQPGTGPDLELIKKGSWQHTVVGYSQEDDQRAAPRVVVAVLGDKTRDSGYWGSARMILEAALCMATQREQLAADGRLQGGVLTPASALGMTLVRRLQDAGFHYEIQHG